MGGGLLQLSAYGAENEYFNGNPQMSFFKFVYKRYTNFSMEDIIVLMDSSNDSLSFDKSTKFKIKIPRNADLISSMYLKLNLPRIVSSDEKKFFWIESIGTKILDYADLYIGGYKIESIRGDLLYIKNQIKNNSKKDIFNKLTGNQSILNHLSEFNQNYTGYSSSNFNSQDSNNINFISKYYNSPSFIKEQILYIPLHYWFTKHFGLSLPLIALQYHNVELEIQFRPVKELYTILRTDKTYYYYKEKPDLVDIINFKNDPKGIRENEFNNSNLSEYKSYYRSSPNGDDEHIKHFIKDPVNGNDEITWNLNLELCIKYIFLDKDERNLYSKMNHSFLIEQNRVFTEFGIKEHANIKFNDIYHAVKNIFFTIERNDNNEYNSHYNFSSKPPIGSNKNILEYQNNWWYDSVKQAEDAPITVTFGVDTIKCDRFQEFLFRYGPNGEAEQYNPAGNESILGFRIEEKYSLYTLKEILDFRENIWMFLEGHKIPVIDNYNQYFWTENPLQQARILFNGQIREDDHDQVYFSDLKNYESYESNPDNKIYSYSFSLYPSKYIPSGMCNMSRVQFLEFLMKLNYPKNFSGSAQRNKYNWEYNIKFYFISYNFFEIQAGMGGLVFAN